MAQRGFTLVELMVVLLIMGVVGSVVMLTVGSRDSTTSDAARFASRVAAARDMAVTTGRPVSIWVSTTGYGFEERRDGQWRPLAVDALEPRDWPQGTEVATSGMAGQAAGLSGGAARLVFDNLGLPDPAASVTIARDGASATVAVAANGDVRVDR